MQEKKADYVVVLLQNGKLVVSVLFPKLLTQKDLLLA